MCTHTQFYEVGAITILILKMRKLGSPKEFVQAYTTT